MTKYESTDRYKATGKPYPDPETMCEGSRKEKSYERD